ncbi:uncharacterized protein LOC127248671 [Andrographis paniculata]|uniref:uncharacterized protein LOC127248671 n=1 Tax=Andrographis paniculata TaxID=175694 RepID=UPI0021E826D2|nr:uncharacterized protein LOC127248671 [Andrographis paniculata]
MEKRLRSSLQTSAEDFLSCAAKFPLKSSKSFIKTLINSLIKPTSDLTSSLPRALCISIAQCISKFKNQSESAFMASPVTPPAKRIRRSGRNKKDDGMSPTKDNNCHQSIVEKLQLYAYIVQVCAFHHENVFSDADLFPAVQNLHDNLILFESDSFLLYEIANLCEEWWKGDLCGKETLISQSLPVILSRSLTLKKKTDVHRIYRLRDAFVLFDFEDESIEDLKNLLIRCVISPLYLKTEEGRKFLAFIFILNVQLTKEVCAMVKSQIPFGRKSVLEAYGEIVFRAWKAVEGECRCEVEKGFLQELVEGAIYASTEALAASIRRMLGVFVDNRTTEGVEKLIFGLAEPILFRSLQVANSNVRRNALNLLLVLFPLEDPDVTMEVKDTLLEKQFFLLEKLLMDDCPDVRLVAVEGCCRILHLFWEVIPSPIITKIITKIFDNMTADTCAEVRLSTVNGVIYLLGNPQSHEILKVLLPRMSKLSMDPTAVVRSSLSDLLLLLNDIGNFQFHKVVSVDDLLSILANDQPVIGRKITKLLIPSYFPSKVTVEEACKRCIALIKRSPAAGARFCEFLALEGACPQSLLKLFKVIIGLIVPSVKLSKELIESLLVAASNLCSNLAKDDSFNAALKEDLSVEKLKTLFSVASTPRAQSSVCNIVSAMSLDSVGGLFEDCMNLLSKFSGLADSVERQADVRSAQRMIFLCGWFDEMFEALVGFLQDAAWGCHEKFGIELEQNFRSATRKKTKSSIRISAKSKHVKGHKSSHTAKDKFLEDCVVADGVAWHIKDLLLTENARKVMLGSGILSNAHYALKVISEAWTLNVLQYDHLGISPISTYTALTLCMSLHKIKPDGTLEFTQAAILDSTLEHLLHCAYNILRSAEKSGTNPTTLRRILTMAKMLTAVLKFVVDVAAINTSSQHQELSLSFTMEILKFIVTNLRQGSIAPLGEKGMKDFYVCLKCFITYGAKLLNIVLTTVEIPVPRQGVCGLVNELFNLLVSVEEFLGHGYTGRLIHVVQPWIPDLILALSSYYLVKQTPDEDSSFDSFMDVASEFPSWLYILAKIELLELRDENSDEETDRVQLPKDFSAFRRLVATMSKQLKSNNKVLDAGGALFLTCSIKALEKKNFDFALGLLHFVCVKLVSPNMEWKELKLMAASLEGIYSEVKTELEDARKSEKDSENLQCIMAVLEPVCASLIYHGRKHSTEEE